MTTRAGAWRAVGGLGLAMTLVACGGGEPAAKPTVPATEVCGGLSPKAAKALEQISETKRFEYRSYGIADSLKELLHDPELDGGGMRTDCVIEPDVADPDESPSRMTVLFEDVDRVPAPQPKVVAAARLPVGLLAEGGDGDADLWFACEVKGVGRPIVHAELAYGSRPREKSPKEANIRVLQDLSHRLALAMGCPDAGGVPSV
ncbi:hypothetical protein [Streptomyces sp. NBC_01353]|uniref:hypothetical protein n=1 Tax=Streptomyces sp. NBC_01353 TaxID=2903835 RepID=UPI002E2EBCEC|nr:hypothetical protein [Streptomyces sp. NBC_01353]